MKKIKAQASVTEVTAKVEEVTAENSVNNNNNGADSDELLAFKVRHTNLEIHRRKSGMKVGLERIRDKQEEILKYTGKILEIEDVISDLTALILYDKLILDELQTKAAALENETVNRKLIDVTDEIATADAVDASVTAMIELNAANNFTAAEVNIAGGYATIDTAISNTVIPVIDEDEDNVKTQAYLAEIADIDAQIAALQAKRDATAQAMSKHLESVTAWAYGAIKATTKDWDKEMIRLIAPDGLERTINKYDVDVLHFQWFQNGEIQIRKHCRTLAIYSTAKQFKAAIRGLVAAIKRGNETFTFPADEIADK